MVIGGDNQADKDGLVGWWSDRERGCRKLDRERREIEGFLGGKREIGRGLSEKRGEIKPRERGE
jgi:hypothetical protein